MKWKKEIKIPTNLSIYEPLWLRLSVLMNTQDEWSISLPFLTTFSLLSAWVWLHCEINALLTTWSAGVWLHCEINAVFDHFFTIVCLCMMHCEIIAVFNHFFTFIYLCMIALWNQCRFWPLFHYGLLVYDCTVKSIPFLTTFSLLSACVWLHCEITAVLITFSLLCACVWLHCKISAVFDHFFTIARLCMIALWNHCRFLLLFNFCLLVYDCIVKSLPFFTTFQLLSVCVWLHCEITAVFDHFFPIVCLCMITL